MKKFFKIAATVVAFAFIIAFFGAVVFKYVHDVSNVGRINAQTEQEKDKAGEELALMEEQETLIFYDMESYFEYLREQGAAEAGQYALDEIGSAHTNELNYLAPVDLPSDATLSSIRVDGEGTIFTYSLAREFPTINFSTDDDVIIEMANSIIVKIYSFPDFVSDHREYARNLAANLGATSLTTTENSDVYSGWVYADVLNTDINAMQRIKIGSQEIAFLPAVNGKYNTQYGVVKYTYYPLSLTEDEVENLVSYTVEPE